MCDDDLGSRVDELEFELGLRVVGIHVRHDAAGPQRAPGHQRVIDIIW